MARSCVFCDRPAGSAEHAWPRWLLQHLNPEGEPAAAQLASGKLVPATSNQFRTRLVCHDCNTVWMARKFEGRASGLIKAMDSGLPRIITANEQRWLAGWAYKTALMLECTQPGGPDITLEAFKAFRSAGTPPPNCSIVLGQSLHPVLAYHRRNLQLNYDQPRAHARQSYSTTMVVSHLLFHIIGDLAVTGAHDLLMPHHMGKDVMRLWPCTGDQIRWPLGSGVPKEGIEALAKAASGERFHLLTDDELAAAAGQRSPSRQP